jgi:Spx/MgsR family transcriptional regulator
MMQLYGLKVCSTCKKALAWLKQAGVEHQFTDYREQPLPAQDLTGYAKSLGGWEKLVNRASPTWRQLTPEQQQAQTDAQWTALIAAYPTLVRRPLIVFDDGTVMVGFNQTRLEQKLGLK